MKTITIEHMDVPVLVRTFKDVLESLGYVWFNCAFDNACTALTMCFEVRGEPHSITLRFDLYSPVVVEMYEWGLQEVKLSTIEAALKLRGVHVCS